MKGKFLGLTENEYKDEDSVDWEYVKKRKADWIDFDFEESSIDLAISCEPRIVVDDISYWPYRQFFISEGGSTTRLLVGVQVHVQKPITVYYSSKVGQMVEPVKLPDEVDNNSKETN